MESLSLFKLPIISAIAITHILCLDDYGLPLIFSFSEKTLKPFIEVSFFPALQMIFSCSGNTFPFIKINLFFLLR